MARDNLTDEKISLLHDVIKQYKGTEGSLMPVLHEGQKIFGALPLNVQRIIAKGLHVPLAEIYGVVTFYSQFTLEPKGDFIVAMCLGTACYVKGSQNIIDRISSELSVDVGKTSADGKFTLEATRCIGACGLAPVLTVNEDVYGRLVEADVVDILKKYT